MFSKKNFILVTTFVFGLITGSAILYAIRYNDNDYLIYNKTGGASVNSKAITSTSTASPVEQNKLQSRVRELPQGGHVIDSSLYYSQKLGLIIHGFLENLSFENNMFTDCPENGCGDLITLFSQDFKGITPEAFIGDLIKKEGGKPSECKIQKDETSTYSTSRYSVRTKDEVIVSKEEIYTAVKDSSDQKFKSRKEYEEYCFKNKDNPTCAYDERYAQIKKEQNLCSKYVGGNVFKGDSAYFLFRMDGSEINSLEGYTNALFINIQAGNGGAPGIDLVQLVR